MIPSPRDKFAGGQKVIGSIPKFSAKNELVTSTKVYISFFRLTKSLTFLIYS